MLKLIILITINSTTFLHFMLFVSLERFKTNCKIRNTITQYQPVSSASHLDFQILYDGLEKKQNLNIKCFYAHWNICLYSKRTTITASAEFQSITVAYTCYGHKTAIRMKRSKSRLENPKKLTQLSPRCHPRHLVVKKQHKKTPS